VTTNPKKPTSRRLPSYTLGSFRAISDSPTSTEFYINCTSYHEGNRLALVIEDQYGEPQAYLSINPHPSVELPEDHFVVPTYKLPTWLLTAASNSGYFDGTNMKVRCGFAGMQPVWRLNKAKKDEALAALVPCQHCGHRCPTTEPCDKCGSDPMESGDKLCADCAARQETRERMRPSDNDRRVIEAFLNREYASSKHLATNGFTLDGKWPGGRIAAWNNGQVIFPADDTRVVARFQRAVQRAMKKQEG